MSAKKRINVEKDLIDHTTLKQLIHIWLSEHKQQIGEDFLVSPKKMKNIQAQFQQKCLQYMIMRTMPWIIRNIEQEKLVYLNTELKGNYQKLIINNFFNTENAFELFIFYLVKLITHFLKKCFSNLLVDITLESQICIVLYYTFLGVEIKQKTYEVIKRKYQNSLSKTRKSHIEDRSIKTSKNSLYESYLKQPIKATSKTRLPKHRNSIHSRQSICRPLKQSFFRDNINDISAILHENLHVKPLPPLKERRVKIRQIQRLKTEPVGESPLYRDIISKESLSKQLKLPKKNFLLSNQLSNSLKTLHPEQLLFELTSKQVKINQSFHDFKVNSAQDPLTLLHKRKAQLKQSFYKKQPECKGELKTSTDWIAIIQDLKKKVFELQCNSFSNEAKHPQQDEQGKLGKQSYTQETNDFLKPIKQNKPNLLPSSTQFDSHENEQISFSKLRVQQTNCLLKVDNYNQQTEDSTTQIQRTEPKILPKKITRNSLRYDQVSFESSCKERLSSFTCSKENHNLDFEWRRHFQRQ